MSTYMCVSEIQMNSERVTRYLSIAHNIKYRIKYRDQNREGGVLNENIDNSEVEEKLLKT